jgi:hypothetical protein
MTTRQHPAQALQFEEWQGKSPAKAALTTAKRSWCSLPELAFAFWRDSFGFLACHHDDRKSVAIPKRHIVFGHRQCAKKQKKMCIQAQKSSHFPSQSPSFTVVVFLRELEVEADVVFAFPFGVAGFGVDFGDPVSDVPDMRPDPWYDDPW